MAVTRPTYVTRQQLAAALDVAPSAAAARELDRCIVEASLAVETLCRRVFYPTTETRSFDYPPLGERTPAFRLWLGENDLTAPPTAITVGGDTLSVADVIPWPNEGPPFEALDVDQGTSAAWSSGPGTWQNAVAVTGVWGHSDTRASVGTLTEALDDSETDIDVTPAAAAEVGIGDVLTVDSERMLVTSWGWATTGATVSLTASLADQSITVVSIAAYEDGELLLLGGERLRIQDRAGTTLTVQRAVDGTTLAAHTTATLFAARTLRVSRGVLGTTAAAHDSGATIERQIYPGPVVELAQAEAEVAWQQKRGGYTRPQGSGEGARPVPSGTLEDTRCRCLDAFGRIRVGAV